MRLSLRLGVSTYQIGKFLFWANTVDHFGEDGFDMQHESNIAIVWNTFKDPLDRPTGIIPTHSSTALGRFRLARSLAIVITRNTEYPANGPKQPIPKSHHVLSAH